MRQFIKRWWFLECVVLLALVAGGVALHSSRAQAQFFDECPAGPVYLGRAPCVGYFTGQYRQAPSGDDRPMLQNGLLAGIDQLVQTSDKAGNKKNADAFMAILEGDLKSADIWDQVGAATIVDVMLGQPGPSFGNSRNTGLAYAKNPANLAKLSALVHQYADKGLIEWGHSTATDGLNGQRVKHMVYDQVIQDSFVKSSPFNVTTTIRFASVNGSEPLEIENNCGNLFGYTGGLVGTPAHGDLNPPTPGSGSTPPGFNTGDSTLYSSCQVISGHAVDPSNAAFKVPVTVSYTISGGGSGTLPVTFASTTSPNLFTVNTTNAIRNSTAKVTITASATDATNAPFALAGSPIVIGPCLQAHPACGGFTPIPASLDPGTPYKVQAAVNYGSSTEAQAVNTDPTTKFYIKIQGPNVNVNLPNVTPITYDGNVGLSATTPTLPPTGQTGDYIVGWGITGNFGAINCGSGIPGNPNPPSFPVTDKPYFTVDGGDLSAGAGMSVGGTNCAVSADDKAGIVSWNKGTAGAYGGAGTAYAALALNSLQDFATGQASGYAPSGLSFANNADGQVNPAAGLFGGQYGSVSSCTADYFANATNIQNGNVTIGAQTIANGIHKTIYVNGDVYITGNITFSGSYANTAEVPSFAVIAKGNIYIAPGVTQLDGFYIAQPASKADTKGNIYTCAPTPFAEASLDNGLLASCNTTLTVTGAFVANQVWLLRTAGTLSTTPAETFNYLPELWLSAPFGNGLGGSTGDYDAITSLPPVL